MVNLMTTADNPVAYERLGVSREGGLRSDVLAAFIKRGHSLAEEMGLGGIDYSKLTARYRPPQYASSRERTDVMWETQGWYRTIKAAKRCGCDPAWLALAADANMLPRVSGRTDLMTERHRVRLEDVREWMGACARNRTE